MKTYKVLPIILSVLLAMTGCAELKTSKTADTAAAVENSEETQQQTDNLQFATENGQSADNEMRKYKFDADSDKQNFKSSNTSSVPIVQLEGSAINTTDLFSERDMKQTYDISDASVIKVADSKNISVTAEGVYVLSGTASNCTITVNAPDDAKVQLVLDGVNITNKNIPAIYVTGGDKVFITTTDSSNTLTETGEFTADGDTNIDAVIFSKKDIVFNGVGTLNITSDANAVITKDDLKITGGKYNIKAAADGFEANDSIAVADGSFTINAEKKAFQCKNEESADKGYIYIADGEFSLTTGNDGIQAVTIVQIDGGDFTISSAEGIEATYIQINDGNISVDSSDDGINATAKCSFYGVAVQINGGDITIKMASGDTDAIDANGSIFVNGGTINITAPTSSFDYDASAEYNGGTIIINGTQVNEIPQSMMGGKGGMGGGHAKW